MPHTARIRPAAAATLAAGSPLASRRPRVRADALRCLRGNGRIAYFFDRPDRFSAPTHGWRMT